MAAEVCHGVRSKTGEGIMTLDPPGIKVMDSVPADRDRSIALRVHQDEPDAGVIGETGYYARVVGLNLFESLAPWVVCEIDHAEVTRGNDDEFATGVVRSSS